MSARTARHSADVAIVTVGLLVLASVKLAYGRKLTGQDSADWIYLAFSAVGAAIYLMIGRAIVTRQPKNTIGWLLIAIPTLAFFALTNGSYTTRALVVDPGSLPFGHASAWLDRWILVPTLAAFIPLFLLYPDGRLPSRRWRPIGVLTVGAPVLTAVAFAVTPGRLTGAMSNLEAAHVTNPLGIEGAAGVVSAATQIGGMLMFASAIAALVAVVVRYRRADAEVRQQIRWLELVGIAFFVQLAIGIGVNATVGGETVGNVLFMFLFLTLALGIPLACGVAILKYRLFELDVIVRKSIVFTVLATFIAAVYAAIVGGVGALVGSRSSSALSFAAAAVLAVLFQPAHARARRLADRLVFGKRATPYEVLSGFSERMGEAFSTEDILPRMAQILASGTGAITGQVWLNVDGDLRVVASWPEDAHPGPDERHEFEVRHLGELLGALAVTMPPNDPLDPSKEKLIRDLAAQAGLVLRNVRLIEELRASRLRLVAAQDEERRRIERNLHDGAQQQLVALAVQLRLAEQMVGRDPGKERELLGRLQRAANDALEDLRDLARGIYPPLLADQGLGAALEAQVRRSSVPVTIEASGIGRYARDVEAAVYFCSLEALNNVAKYSGASGAAVRLAQVNGSLAFEVHDDGKGFDPATTGYGTGLQGMADRLEAIGGALEVQSEPGHGTTVSGSVPAAAVPSG